MTDFFERWTAALTSGHYTQCREELYLRSTMDDPEPQYCCLGVALKMDNHEMFYEHLIPNLTNDEQNYFAILNDKHGLTFTEIALVINNVPREEWNPSLFPNV